MKPSMRRRPPRRVLRTAVAVVLVSMPVGACSIPESNAPAPRNVTITALTPEQAEEAVGQGGYSSPHTEPMPTESGWVQVFDELPADGRTGASLIISRDENEAVQWAVNTDRPAASSDVLEKTHAPQARTDSMGNNLLTMTNYVYGYAISDPSGARMSLILAPDETDGDTPDETDRDAPDETDRDTPDETGYNAAKNAKEDEDSNAAIAEQRSHVLVLDTATGETVRVVEVDGMVLGQALTSDELVVETAQRYFPGDSGQGALHVFSLTDPAAEPLTLPTDKWVVGSGASSVLLSQRPPRRPLPEDRLRSHHADRPRHRRHRAHHRHRRRRALGQPEHPPLHRPGGRRRPDVERERPAPQGVGGRMGRPGGRDHPVRRCRAVSAGPGPCG